MLFNREGRDLAKAAKKKLDYVRTFELLNGEIMEEHESSVEEGSVEEILSRRKSSNNDALSLNEGIRDLLF